MNESDFDPHANVARIVRVHLADRRKRQSELASVLGMDSGTMSRAMNGKRDWALEDLMKMAKFFDISVAVFFDDADSLLRGIRPDRDENFTGYLHDDHPTLFDLPVLAMAS